MVKVDRCLKVQDCGGSVDPGIHHGLSSTFQREVIRLSVCKTGVEKYYVGSDDWSITSASHHLNAE
jgi:hypothetical protein